MKREVFEKRFTEREYEDRLRYQEPGENLLFSLAEPCASDMRLALGGRMRQEIYEDPFKLSDWIWTRKVGVLFIWQTQLVWRAITGDAPPSVPFTAKEYNDHGLPWLDDYSDNSTALKGSSKLKRLQSVVEAS